MSTVPDYITSTDPRFPPMPVVQATQTARVWMLEHDCTQLAGLAPAPRRIRSTERPPQRGWIVKGWDNGGVWAGYYDGSAKLGSCDWWLPIPD